jgi:hypothetical protein
MPGRDCLDFPPDRPLELGATQVQRYRRPAPRRRREVGVEPLVRGVEHGRVAVLGVGPGAPSPQPGPETRRALGEVELEAAQPLVRGDGQHRAQGSGQIGAQQHQSVKPVSRRSASVGASCQSVIRVSRRSASVDLRPRRGSSTQSRREELHRRRGRGGGSVRDPVPAFCLGAIHRRVGRREQRVHGGTAIGRCHPDADRNRDRTTRSG